MSRKDNESLLRATENKNDEFFTRYEDIEKRASVLRLNRQVNLLQL